MNPELKQKWVAALRSGEYRQGCGRLRSGQGNQSRWCCLGVLADQLDPDGWVRSKSTGGWYHSCGVSAGYLDHVDGLTRAQQGQLIGLNDMSGLSFDKIADFVEENY